MRLLILTQKVDAGDDNLGFFHRWIEEFAKQCERVTVICLYEGEHHLPENVRVLSLGKESGVSRIKYLKRFYTYIWRERKNYNAVFVHMNQIYVILGGLVWRVLGKRIGLWYAHGTVSLSLRLAVLLSHAVLTSSEAGMRIKTKKRHVVGQGIDTETFFPGKQQLGGVRALIVGRIDPVKHVDIAVDAMHVLKECGMDAHLSIVGVPSKGNEEYLRQLQNTVRASSLPDVVTFLGGIPYDKLPDIYRRANVYVHLGMTGSIDKVALEAMASGLLVVSSNPAVSALLNRFKSALSVSALEPQSVADAIRHVCELSQPEREVMASHFRNLVVAEHSLESFVRKITLLLR